MLNFRCGCKFISRLKNGNHRDPKVAKIYENFVSEMSISRATNKYKGVGEVELKIKTLRHFKVETVQINKETFHRNLNLCKSSSIPL